MSFLEQLIGSQSGLLVAFLITVAVVVLTGIRLSIYGDALGDRTGLGSGLVGLIFLAAVTSLPELVVSLTSVIQNADLHKGADLATGNMLGSNVFNLLILAFMVLVFPRRFEPRKLKQTHTDSIVYGLILLGIFTLAFISARLNPAVLPGLRCNWITLLLPVAYGFILRREHRQQQQQTDDEPEEQFPEEQALAHLSAGRFYATLIGLCGLIIGGGVVLSILGSRMALPPAEGGFGLEASLIGTLFLAIATSLPELVISFASVRMGFLDMAVGNVLGSNMFNLLIIFVSDVAMRHGNLLEQADIKHSGSVGLIALLTLLAWRLLHAKTRKQSTTLAVLMIAAYLTVLTFFA